MTRFSLGYWKIRGLAAAARMLLWYIGEKDFEDVRYEVGEAPDFDRESWLSVKFSLGLDFPNLPYLIDHQTGVRLTQTLAVLQYIAEASGQSTLFRGSPELAAYSEMLAHVVIDFRNGLVSCCYGSRSDEQVEAYRTKLPAQLAPLESWLASKSQGQYLLKDLSYVDFYLAEHLDQLRILFPDSLASFPLLSSYVDRFLALPEIQSFRESKYYMVGPINNKMAYLTN